MATRDEKNITNIMLIRDQLSPLFDEIIPDREELAKIVVNSNTIALEVDKSLTILTVTSFDPDKPIVIWQAEWRKPKR